MLQTDDLNALMFGGVVPWWCASIHPHNLHVCSWSRTLFTIHILAGDMSASI